MRLAFPRTVGTAFFGLSSSDKAGSVNRLGRLPFRFRYSQAGVRQLPLSEILSSVRQRERRSIHNADFFLLLQEANHVAPLLFRVFDVSCPASDFGSGYAEVESRSICRSDYCE